MLVTEIINCHINHLFSVLSDQVDAAIEDVLATSFFCSNSAVCQELEANIGKAAEGTVSDRQASPANHRATHQTIEAGSLVKDLSQYIVKNYTVIMSFSTHVKRQVDQMMDNWPVTKYFAKTVANFSDRVDNVEKV